MADKDNLMKQRSGRVMLHIINKFGVKPGLNERHKGYDLNSPLFLRCYGSCREAD